MTNENFNAARSTKNGVFGQTLVKHNGQYLINHWRHQQDVVDTKTGEVLAAYIDFSTAQQQRQAGWSGWKFWLENGHCENGAKNQDDLRSFRNNFMGAVK